MYSMRAYISEAFVDGTVEPLHTDLSNTHIFKSTFPNT